MSWNYRVTRQRGEYAIREVYYAEDGTINAWSTEPVFPAGETTREFRKALGAYERAAMKPTVHLAEEQARLDAR